jgi:hypothetical protein
VPIRDENLVYSPVINSVERGTAYAQTVTRQVRDARFYVHRAPADFVSFQVAAVNLYPFGLEADTGPIQQVLIPAKSVTITGNNISLQNSSSYADALYQPGDDKYATFNYNSGSSQLMSLFFDVSSYPVLANKRILNVSLAYAGSVQDTDAVGLAIDYINPPGTSLTVLTQMNDLGSGQQFTASSIKSNTGTLGDLSTVVGRTGSSRADMQVAYVDLGDVNNCWNTASLGSSEKMPWRYADLLRFEPGYGAGRQQLQLSVAIPLTANGFPAGTGNDVRMTLEYAALRVIYCEERRVAYGAQQFGYSYGMNRVVMRDLSQNADPIVPAGLYTPTLSFVSIGQIGFGGNLTSDFPELNAARQLYEIPSHPGVEVDIPFPLPDHIGDPFTLAPPGSTGTMILPQISLHASGGTLTEPHVYGRQVAAQVWGTKTAIQEIYDDISGSAASYPQVRYYARRFGNTTVPLTLTGNGVFTGSTTSITAATFDDLPEILDGWREVTLRFTTAPNMGAATGTPGWVWSAAGESAGNRWEVLGASAPAISGVPGSLYTLVPSPNQLGAATYQPPSGATVELTWMPQGVASVWVTGASADAATDAVLMFSQDPATITGVGISQLTQPVSGVGLLCGSLPCCIPSGIGYQQVTWSLPVNTINLSDSFARTVVAGMGSADVGGAYTTTGNASQYAVDGTQATITPDGAGTSAAATLAGARNFEATAVVGLSGTAVGEGRAALVGRFVTTLDHLQVLVQADTTGTTIFEILNASVGSLLSSTITLPFTIGAGAFINLKMLVQDVPGGTQVKGKAWPLDEPEPALWTGEGFTASPPAGTAIGLLGRSNGLGAVVRFQNFQVGPPSYWFGAYELQRYDSVAAAFQTIMLATNPGLAYFNDYEARVGIPSVYRIRNLNAYNFAGAWSTYVTGTQASPGITGGCSDMTGALIFTSNADQTGADNAAYEMQWDGTPTEGFSLPEAEMVQFQPMYGRDGSVAFHGTERGLETFDRTVLLAAGAIALPSLADATTIRDLAWAQLPYVCVRDHRGNRWFANVRVPTTTARNDAQNYVARLTITETTQTPYPVDP